MDWDKFKVIEGLVLQGLCDDLFVTVDLYPGEYDRGPEGTLPAIKGTGYFWSVFKHPSSPPLSIGLSTSPKAALEAVEVAIKGNDEKAIG